jgi:hypothetical protein
LKQLLKLVLTTDLFQVVLGLYDAGFLGIEKYEQLL